MQEKKEKVNLELLNYKLDQLQKDIGDVQDTIKEQMVSRSEFEIRVGRIEKIVFGLIGMILVAFLGALIALVIK